MAILVMLLAASLASTANLFMRRSIDAGGTTRAYLVIQLFISLLVAIGLSPARTGNWTFSWPPVLLGLLAGLFLGGLLWTLGRALERGPSGLTFAVLNAATVLPAIVMVLTFGPEWGHQYTLFNGIGSLLVVAGLVWAGLSMPGIRANKYWLWMVIGTALCHIALLVLLQWRAILLNSHPPSWRAPFILSPETGQWFAPMMFLAAWFIQFVSFLNHERRWPNPAESIYGLCGGTLQGVLAFFLILAPELATPLEQAMIFPIYSVTIILFTNLWSQALYKEKVHWLANSVCLAGLAIGTINWSALF